MSIEQRIVVV